MADVRQQLEDLRIWREAGTLKAAVATQRLGAELSAVQATLRSAKSELARLDELKTLAGQPHLVRRTDRAALVRDATRIKACGTELLRATTPDALANWQRNRWKDVPEAGKALEAAFRHAWSGLCNDTFDEFERLARVLERLEPTKKLGQKMLVAAAGGLKLRQVYPPGKGTWDEFALRAGTCRQCRDEISGTDGASGVAELLLKAADGKATLADVSPELRQWLSNNNVLKAFRLTLA